MAALAHGLLAALHIPNDALVLARLDDLVAIAPEPRLSTPTCEHLLTVSGVGSGCGSSIWTDLRQPNAEHADVFPYPFCHGCYCFFEFG